MNVCVFCGSSFGINPIYKQAAETLGKLMPSHGMKLVYGGGNVGLMGTVADAVMQSGGEVIGVIPDFLSRREVAHQGLTRLEVVGSMHERKKRMADLSHAFIALPGGWGTLEELAEVLTWRQLGLVSQPVALLNINNFFDPLLDQLRKMVQEGFVNPKNFEILKIGTSPEQILQVIAAELRK
jgi:uncharacterized protein (TIGR00730 family)